MKENLSILKLFYGGKNRLDIYFLLSGKQVEVFAGKEYCKVEELEARNVYPEIIHAIAFVSKPYGVPSEPKMDKLLNAFDRSILR